MSTAMEASGLRKSDGTKAVLDGSTCGLLVTVAGCRWAVRPYHRAPAR